MNFIKYFDVFDIKFNFYVENQPIHHNIFGGIITLSYIVISIYIFIFLEYDGIHKLNPISSKSEIAYEYENQKIKFDKEKIWIPFRIVTNEKQFIDHRGILYPIIYYVKGRKNNENIVNLEYKKLNYKLCNETTMVNKNENYIIDVKLNELFCIDEDELNVIGGSWNKEEIYYIRIDLFLCKEGINFNETDSKCTKFNDLFYYKNSSWLFEFFYPTVQFQPINNKIPIVVVYKNHYYSLSNYTSKADRIYLKQNILSDDQSLFVNKPINSSYWGVSNFYIDNYLLLSKPDFLIEGSSSRLYSLIIYKDQGIIYYTRSYKKVIRMLSDIFPIWNIIFIVLRKITKKIKSIFIKKSLMELLFENGNMHSHKVKENKIVETPKFQKIIKGNEEIPNDRNSQLLNLNKHNQSSNCINLNNKTSKKLLKWRFSEINNPIVNKIYNAQFNLRYLSANKKIKNNNKKLFPLYFYLMDILLDNLIRPKKLFCVSDKYIIAYNFMSQIYDVSTYVLLYKQFNVLKKSLRLNKITLLRNQKINIKNSEIMGNINNDIEGKKNILYSKTVIFDD